MIFSARSNALTPLSTMLVLCIIALLYQLSAANELMRYSTIIQTTKTNFENANDFDDLKKKREKFDNIFQGVDTTETQSDSIFITKAYCYYYYWTSIYSVLQRSEIDRNSKSAVRMVFEEMTTVQKLFVESFKHIPDSLQPEDLQSYYRRANQNVIMDRFNKDIREKPAPDFSGKSLNSEMIRLSDYHGKYVIIHFWHSKSKTCIDEISDLKAAYSKFKHQDLKIISVNFDYHQTKWDTAVLKNFVGELSIDWIHVIEDENKSIHKLYHVRGWPKLFLINKEGYLIEHEYYLREERLITTLNKYFQSKPH